MQMRMGLIILGMLMSGATAWAAPDAPFAGFAHDTSQPVEIAADSLEVRRAEQKAIFRGDVDVRQGPGIMRAQELEVFYKEGAEPGSAEQGAIKRIKARGSVFISNGKETAEGDWADYDVAGEMIIMGGGVMLTQGESAISGKELHIDLKIGKGEIKGGRVRALFSPEAQ